MNILNEIKNIEFLNSIDSAIFEILYSKRNGYLNLETDNAVAEFDKFIKKFEKEIEKIAQENTNDNFKNIISEKKQEFLKQITKIYHEKINLLLDKTFNQLFANTLFYCEIYRDNNELSQKYYNFGIKAINWYSNIKKLNEKESKKILQKFKKEYLANFKSEKSSAR